MSCVIQRPLLWDLITDKHFLYRLSETQKLFYCNCSLQFSPTVITVIGPITLAREEKEV